MGIIAFDHMIQPKNSDSTRKELEKKTLQPYSFSLSDHQLALGLNPTQRQMTKKSLDIVHSGQPCEEANSVEKLREEIWIGR